MPPCESFHHQLLPVIGSLLLTLQSPLCEATYSPTSPSPWSPVLPHFHSLALSPPTHPPPPPCQPSQIKVASLTCVYWEHCPRKQAWGTHQGNMPHFPSHSLLTQMPAVTRCPWHFPSLPAVLLHDIMGLGWATHSHSVGVTLSRYTGPDSACSEQCSCQLPPLALFLHRLSMFLMSGNKVPKAQET